MKLINLGKWYVFAHVCLGIMMLTPLMFFCKLNSRDTEIAARRDHNQLNTSKRRMHREDLPEAHVLRSKSQTTLTLVLYFEVLHYYF